jgi:hypothetical protein
MAATPPENQGILSLGEEFNPNASLIIENYLTDLGLVSSPPDISKMWFLGSGGTVFKIWDSTSSTWRILSVT